MCAKKRIRGRKIRVFLWETRLGAQKAELEEIFFRDRPWWAMGLVLISTASEWYRLSSLPGKNPHELLILDTVERLRG